MKVNNVMGGKTPLYCSPIKVKSLTPKQWREIFKARVEAARVQAGERFLAFTMRATSNIVH